MNLLEANKRLKKSRNTEKESDVSMVVVNSVVADNSERVVKLLQRTGIQEKINQAMEDSNRVAVKDSPEGLLVSVDGSKPKPYAPRSVDYYLKHILGLKDKGFYPLYRKLLADLPIIAALSCAHIVLEHDLDNPKH